MNVEKLKIGNTYYCEVGQRRNSYKHGVLVEIIDDKHVILENNKKRFRCNIHKLHVSADKAMVGQKAQARAREDMKQLRIKEMSEGIDKSVIEKVKKIGYQLIYNKRYIVCGTDKSFDTLEELGKWVDGIQQDLDLLKKNAHEYKFLLHKGNTFQILNISFKKFVFICRQCAMSEERITGANTLDASEYPMFKLNVVKTNILRGGN